MAACTVSTPTSPSVMTKQRLIASASSAAIFARPPWSREAIGSSPTGLNQAAVRCSYPIRSSATASASGSASNTRRPASDQTALMGYWPEMSISLAAASAAMPRGIGTRKEASQAQSSAQPK
eukprot:7547959-Alexandrium_andersonii.AAC.1